MPMTRISEQALEILKEIAIFTGESRQEILLKALEAYKRQRFLEKANEAFAALKSNPDEWKAEQEEREAWSFTLGDGLDKE
ncbi:hypothetical protein E308F_17120 [Moorella sp. E308F]|jgi:ribosomal protein L12E/L44/L45/RPP1/RPP2|uniref:toxin-antitoxin system protein n=1 Tax=unclassified Neomoorella TaxID=2676739 RepID=UPI0010FFC13A|nr:MULTISPECIES: toxin-antitoxin system protein [unclassified Moorella (in: firmicutes)]GEA15468.1 hypothetical protein E308F_17120 [Moorella sp. E308F]GEA19674.1 hypothetical protein E306M_28120 [Moorella sp. E306M]